MTTSIDELLHIAAEKRRVLAAALVRICGGPELLEWFGGEPEFGDAEVISLVLDREGPSRLLLALQGRKRGLCIFELASWIDADVRGFSAQNVIGGLTLRRAEERKIEGWEVGVGLQSGEWMIELEPCFGAYGTIRADIARITVE